MRSLAATLFASLLLASPLATYAEETPAHRLAMLKTEDERICALAEAGGNSPALRDGIAAELMAQRDARNVDASLAVFLERLGREHHDEQAVAVALNTLGVLEEQARHWSAAAALYEEAAARARACGADAAVADAGFGLAFVYRGLGYGEAMLPTLVEARAAAERSGKRKMYALIVNMTAVWKRNHGDLDEAIADYQEARGIMEALGDLEAVAGITNNLGSVYRELGDNAQAIRAFDEALATAEKIRNDRVISYALNNLGTAYTAERDDGRAQAVFERSLELKTKLKDPSASSTELNLGEIARHRHRSKDAFRWYARAIADASSQSDWERVALTQCDMAQLALDDGRPHMALDIATHAAGLSKSRSLVSPFAAAMSMRGHALQRLGQPGPARAAYDEAIAATEEERTHAGGGSEPQRALFLEQRVEPYFGAVSLLHSSNPAEALTYAEKTKARVLLDLLHGDPVDAGVPRGPVPGTRSQAPATGSPAFGETPRDPGPGTPHPAPRSSFHLTKDEAAIEFVTAETETIAFVITGSRVQARRVELFGPELIREVHELRAQIAQRDLRADATAARIFHRLFARTWPLVNSYKHLIIVPDGPLWELPFAALVTTDGHYLVEHAAITLAPSLGARAAMHARAQHRETAPLELLAFGRATARDGLPPLPEAEEQARKIAALYGTHGRVYAGEGATETRLKNEITDARILHIATHGALNDANPMYSHLLLGADTHNDGRLNAREIMHLPLRSELAVLSACETARGRTHLGEGVVGLAWAFFLAGCPSTVVSQWNVDAATTTTLMLAFHKQLRDGATKSDALRNAALTILHDPKSRHPFYWAPFVLIGDDGRI
jgi:CHAT domain-containing protein/tetratricopeptide (TPR) repeat protein